MKYLTHDQKCALRQAPLVRHLGMYWRPATFNQGDGAIIPVFMPQTITSLVKRGFMKIDGFGEDRIADLTQKGRDAP